MKKLPIILVAVLLVVVALLYWINSKQPKEFDKRVTFSRKETRPYATTVMHQLLGATFPKAKIKNIKETPVDWYDEDSSQNGKQVYFVVSKQFYANQNELKQLSNFAQQGNIVFISSEFINEDALDFFQLKVENESYSNFFEKEDSVNTHLTLPAFNPEETYFNPGFTSNKFFKFKKDSNYTILGKDHDKLPNFIEAKVGNGKIILHSDPYLFSNYFILSNNNANYVSNALSTITNKPEKIFWDEYYLYKYNSNSDFKNSKGSLSTLLSFPAFAWAFWLCLILGALYLVVFIKRKQRFVPEVKPLQNDSLAFVQTIGRLYYDNKDHLNLATKMSLYLLEHIRAKYNVPTNKLDEEFVKTLSGKSGYPLPQTEKLISEIRMLHKKIELTENGLINYYKLFNHFYKHT